MKKLLLFSIVFFTSFLFVNAQTGNFVSISPNGGLRGQTLTTVVTGTGFSFTTGSAPNNTLGDFYMHLGATTIYPVNAINIINNNIFSADWIIPSNTPVGNYTVTWDEFSVLGNTYHDVPGGFNIGDAFVSGNVFVDYDSSLTQNGTEPDFFNQEMLLLPDSIYTYTDINGAYQLVGSNGLKTVKILTGPIWHTTTGNTATVNLAGNNVTGIDFGIKGNSNVYAMDLSVTCATVPRCYNTVPYVATCANNGTVPFDGEIIFYVPTNATYAFSNIPPSSISGSYYHFTFTNLQPGQIQNIIVYMILPGPGSVIIPFANANALDPSSTIVATDFAQLTQGVLCSYDPNDKSVVPEGVQFPRYTLMSDSLDFVIRFQNTGNDTAFTVVVIDTLDLTVLDLNTFQMIAYSHPVIPEIKTNGTVTFTFDNILLPDSNVNEPASHGFVRFRCKAKTGLTNGTVLNNTAFIYFDLNSPVITNTTLNTLVYQIPLGIAENAVNGGVTIIPNPVTENALLTFPNDASENFEFNMYDVQGRVVQTQMLNSNHVAIAAENLPKGIYFYELRNEINNKNFRGKFIVM